MLTTSTMVTPAEVHQDQWSQDLIPRYSVSALATAIQYTHCKKHFYLLASGKRQSASPDSAPVNKKVNDSIKNAHCDRGMAFEERLFQRHHAIMADHTYTSPEDFTKVITEAQPGTYLYQLKCVLPESFYTDIIHNTSAYRMNSFIPDFLYIYQDPVSKIKKIRIIDAKSSKELSKTHQFQVTSYAFFLSYLVKDIRQVEVDELGGVWLPSDMEAPVTFRIDFVLNKIKYVFMDVLVNMSFNKKNSTAEVDAVQQQRSNGRSTEHTCPQCKEEFSHAFKSISYPGHPQQNHSDTLEQTDTHLEKKAVPNLDTLADLLQRLGMSNGHPLPEDYIDMYRQKQPRFMGYSTVLAAKEIDHEIYLYLQIDVFTQKPFVYGLQVVDVNNKENSDVLEAFYSVDYSKYNNDDEQELQKAYSDFVDNFIQDLIEALRYMDEHQSRCVFYVYHPQEKKVIQQFLYSIARLSLEGDGGEDLVTVNAERRKEIIQDAMRCLVILFQDTQLLGLPGIVQFPDMDAMTPASIGRFVSIEALLRQNVVFGMEGHDHDLMDVVDWMATSAASESSLERAGLDMNHVYSFWKGDTEKDHVPLLSLEQNIDVTSCTTETLVLHRFTYLQAIMATYWQLARDYMVQAQRELFPLACKPFQWPSVQSFNHPLLAKLVFFKQLECMKACDEVRMDRIKDLTNWERQQQQQLSIPSAEDEPLETGGLILELTRMEKRNQYDYKLTFSVSSFLNGPHVQQNLDRLSIDNFRQYILVPDSRDGIVETIRFSDLLYMSAAKYKKIGIRCVDVEEVYPNEVVLCGFQISMRIKRWRLYRRFTSFTTVSAINALKRLDEDPHAKDTMHLLEDPNMWADENVVDDINLSYNTSAIQLREHLSMSPSQKEISVNILKKRLQIIWGPPGSGKTEFLALFINWYIKCFTIHSKSKKNLTIGITAFTRDAIVNLLKRVEKVQRQHGLEDLFSIMYVTEYPPDWSLDGTSRILCSKWKQSMTTVYRMRRKANSPVKIFVVGATVWSWDKIRQNWKTFQKEGCDMMILDESTQLLVSDALLAMACLSQRGGKLIVAGDHLQLGPILKNNYALGSMSRRIKEPMLYGSIQQCLMRTEENQSIPLREFLLQKGVVHHFGPNTLQLKDNWRMNDELNEFFQQVYGPEYTSRFPHLRLPIDLSLLQNENRRCALNSSSSSSDETKSRLISSILDPSRPISLIKVVHQEDTGITGAVEKEAQIVQQLVDAYLCCRVDNSGQQSATETAATATKPPAMIVVPHHQQRVAILRRVPEYIPVDTVEKMQGQECDLIIACFSCLPPAGSNSNHEFLRDFRRWNVALSRARCKIIVLTVDALLNPHPMEGILSSFTHTLEPTDGWALLCLLQEWTQKKQALWEWHC